jgi:hypothetical protein
MIHLARISNIWMPEDAGEGTEPSYSAWKGADLPLSYTRISAVIFIGKPVPTPQRRDASMKVRGVPMIVPDDDGYSSGTITSIGTMASPAPAEAPLVNTETLSTQTRPRHREAMTFTAVPIYPAAFWISAMRVCQSGMAAPL